MKLRPIFHSPILGGLLAALAFWLLQALLWVTGALHPSLDWIRFLLPLGMAGIFFVALGVAILEPLDYLRHRGKPRQWIAQASLYWAAGTLLALWFANPLRAGWFLEKEIVYRPFARRAQPMIDAIRRYETDHGQPPVRLDDLVPAYLPGIPGTGLAVRDQEFGYARTADRRGATPTDQDGNPWTLQAAVPNAGILKFDYLFYYPNQNYPKENGAGSIEMVHGWGYVHE